MAKTQQGKYANPEQLHQHECTPVLVAKIIEEPIPNVVLVLDASIARQIPKTNADPEQLHQHEHKPQIYLCTKPRYYLCSRCKGCFIFMSV